MKFFSLNYNTIQMQKVHNRKHTQQEGPIEYVTSSLSFHAERTA